MSTLNKETRNIQNPALGSVLLWRFATGYAEGSKEQKPTPLPLLFLVLPIILHQETVTFIKSTRKNSGLRAFVDKFAESKISKNDLILAIHDRALKMRNLTKESLQLSIMSHLLTIDADGGVAIPLSKTPPRSGIPDSVKKLLTHSEKLGYWCSELTLHEISLTLKIGF